MMASALLRDRVQIRTSEGTDGRGREAFSMPRRVRCRLVYTQRVTAGPEGVDRVSALTVQVRPDTKAAAGDLVELPSGEVHTVSQVKPVGDLTRPHHIELILDTSKTARAA